jgi:DNA-binding GntR family transcriptional regulator
MARFEVSNSPLREAFAQLAAEGLLEVHPNRGAVVAPLTPDAAADLLRVGSLLWELVYRWAVPRCSAADRAALRRIGTDFDLAYRSGDVASAILEGERFDERLLEASGSPELNRAVQAGWPRLMRLARVLTGMQQLDARALLLEHVVPELTGGLSEQSVTLLSRYWASLESGLTTRMRAEPPR